MGARRKRVVTGAMLVGGLVVGAGLAFGPVRAALNHERACESISAYLAAEGQEQTVGQGAAAVRVLGDSYVSGDALPDRSDRWVEQLAAELSATVTIDAVGFTGYTNGGCSDQPFESRVAVLEGPATSVIVAGGLNDIDASPGELALAAERTLDAIDTTAPVFIIGPASTPARGDVSWIDEILEDAATQRNMTYVRASAWDLPMLADDTHMTPAGHATYAAKVAELLAN